MSFPTSTISQPSSKVDASAGMKCSIYAPMAAYQVTTGIEPKVESILSQIPARLGGNGDKAFGLLCGYGLTFTAKDKWQAAFSRAAASRHPIAIGVTWKNGKNTGNHWVYCVGYDAGGVHARDQQNNHLEILIKPGAWEGTAAGGWTYVVTQISLGCANREAARPYT